MTQTASAPIGLDPDRKVAHPTAIVAIGCFCGIVVALTQTMIVPLVPLLPSLLHTSAANASWAVTATLLTAAVMMPISGRLGDMVGKRLMLVLSLAALVIGSVLCALSDSLLPMVVGRGLQGVSMGAIALGISIMRDELPADRVGPAVARMSATLGVGGAIGLPVAAVIVEKANWHALFWIAAGLGALCLIAVLAVVPESPVRTPARFDVLGAIGLASGLVMLLLAISKGGDWGWGDHLTLGLLLGSLVVFAIWTSWELRVAAPLVDLRTTARPQVLFTNVASIGAGFAMYGMSLVPIQLLLAPEATGYGSGLTLIQAGLVLMPGGLMMYLFSGIGARITAARGPRAALMTGVAIIAVGYVVLLFLRAEWWQISIAGAITSAGVGVAYAAMPALIMGAVPVHETAAANGLNALMRSVGTSLSAAVVGTVLAHQTVRLGAIELPSERGFTIVVLISLAASAVALALTLAIPRRTPA
ncbi:MFS transporter [Nocardioides marmoriginsengisoli]|uniref:MFS transporter n=1 Tax=Nocardioides marmoriginsengisoli TaxID=661483 RepID=A0A3N0CAV2_9ACTN|nr:MFS transporter [Nocardioides marmoriginsengisoli]RNL60449.1 MFS transporter [Nocardioides marmoriginsengisoli]